METRLAEEFQNTSEGKEAETILRACVHCGFCNATCPTYQLLGDENDGPRGRIYLIKQMLEGKLEKPADSHHHAKKTLLHLDRCLTCRNCETTCPSGVQYAKLLDIGRNVAENIATRPRMESQTRAVLRKVLPYSKRFSALLSTGRLFKPLLPAAMSKKIPRKGSPLDSKLSDWPKPAHARRMLILDGCVQPAISPEINLATALVLDKLGISLLRIKKAGCCGAVSQHLSAEEEALQFMRRNIDAWWNEISDKDNGVEAIISTASGCGAMLKDYYHYLKHDPEYAHKAKRVSSLSKDIAEVILQESAITSNTTNNTISTSNRNYKKALQATTESTVVAWHPPCTLQHGQKITGVVEKILTDAGFTLVPVNDQHLCCGSAGTYSILQPEISNKLRDNKLTNLLKKNPEMIVTANIGCQTHLQESTDKPVVHWITLFA
ncbi:MAG: glycolate oxidase subunit GlcF [Thiotrichaceae bacterium]